MRRVFVTGTDTEIGKTHAAGRLIEELVRQGHRVAGLKPVASGCERTSQGLRNEDALALMAAANVELAYEQVNPFAYEPAIAPHLAAEDGGAPIDTSLPGRIVAGIEADFVIVEGVGGWCVPLSEDLMLADLARAMCEEVILVVGLRLGCINHALLTAQQVRRDGFELTGWIANTLDPAMPVLAGNVRSIEQRIGAPLLATLPWDDAKMGVPDWSGLPNWQIRNP